jgi:hypothetical protein
VRLPKQKSLDIAGRDTSGEVARDGILPGESTTIPGLIQSYLFGLLTTESFCSAVWQHCQGQGGQEDKQNRITPNVESK